MRRQVFRVQLLALICASSLGAVSLAATPASAVARRKSKAKVITISPYRYYLLTVDGNYRYDANENDPGTDVEEGTIAIRNLRIRTLFTAATSISQLTPVSAGVTRTDNVVRFTGRRRVQNPDGSDPCVSPATGAMVADISVLPAVGTAALLDGVITDPNEDELAALPIPMPNKVQFSLSPGGTTSMLRELPRTKCEHSESIFGGHGGVLALLTASSVPPRSIFPTGGATLVLAKSEGRLTFRLTYALIQTSAPR